MTDVGEFIDDFLQHDYDPVKAREYYLRTRKLKGRAVKKVKQLADKAWETDKEYSAKVNKAAGQLNRDRALAKAARKERLAMQQRRIDQARAKARKVKDPKKRGLVERKLDALEKRLKSGFGNAKLSRSKSKPLGDIKLGKPKNPFAGAKLSRTKS